MALTHSIVEPCLVPERPLVTQDEFEARLEQLRATVSDPRAGVFGPSSKLWEVNRHSIIFLAAGRAAFLQVAHPYVAHAITQHSISLSHPILRFQRTFAGVFAMVYGDIESALAAARHVHRTHTGIRGVITEDVGAFEKGTHYAAKSPEALFWVHATLWDSSVRIFEYFVRRLDPAEKEQYYEETKRFAFLFGVPDEVIPPTWSDFIAYNEAMWRSDTLAVGEQAATICESLLTPPTAALHPMMRWYRGIVAGQLPERIRDQFGLELNLETYWRSMRRLRVLEPRLPRRLRFLPAYVAAMRRIEGRTRRDPIGELLDRAFVGTASQHDRAP
jgi:uncharacterized protein (DUF2236 family)